MTAVIPKVFCSQYAYVYTTSLFEQFDKTSIESTTIS